MGLKDRLIRAWRRFWGPSRFQVLSAQVDHLAMQLGVQQQLTRELLRDVTHASQAQAVAMQDFVAMVRLTTQAQQPQGPCERRVATDESEYESWLALQQRES